MHDLVSVQRRHPAAEHASGRQDAVAARGILQQRGWIDALREDPVGQRWRGRESDGASQEAAPREGCARG